MTRAVIEESIKATLNEVEGLGRIGYTNPQFVGAMTDEDILATFGNEGELEDHWNFWMVERLSTVADDSETAAGQVAIGSQLHKLHTFRITGYTPLRINEDDRTTNGPEFQDLVDKVLTAFDEKPALGGFDATPIQLDSIATGMAVGRVCFRAIMRIAVLDVENVRRQNW